MSRKINSKETLEKGITTVVFDRSGYEYHGRIQAVAEGAREGGLKIIETAGSSNGKDNALWRRL